MWLLLVLLFVLLNVLFTQSYKINTNYSKSDGAITVLLQLSGSFFAFCLIPFFEFKLSNDWKIYVLFASACIFYTISDRMNTTVRTGIQASTFSIIQQLSTVFMIVAGLIFFKEEVIIKKLIGAALIVMSNVLIFYNGGNPFKRNSSDKKSKIENTSNNDRLKTNKYIALGIIACIAYSVALFLDVNLSDNFNVALYAGMTLFVPGIILMAVERITITDLKEEIKSGKKLSLLATGASWGPMLVFQLRAYQIGEVTMVAPLCALTVLGCVIAGYIFLRERDALVKKIVAAITIIISVILIKG